MNELKICAFLNCDTPGTEYIKDHDLFLLRTKNEQLNKCCRYLCNKHYLDFVKFYSLRQKTCSDPYIIHKSVVSGDWLVEITLNDATKYPGLIPGRKLCHRCKTMVLAGKKIESQDVVDIEKVQESPSFDIVETPPILNALGMLG